MKKQLLNLIFSTVVLATSPAFAMEEELKESELSVSRAPLNAVEREKLQQRYDELLQRYESDWERSTKQQLGGSSGFLGFSSTPEDALRYNRVMEMKTIESQLGTEGTLDALCQKKLEKLGKERELERLKRSRENLESGSRIGYRGMTPYQKEEFLKDTDIDIERLTTELGVNTRETPRS